MKRIPRWTLVFAALCALLALALGTAALTEGGAVPPSQVEEPGPTSVVTTDPDGPGPLPGGLPRLEGALVVDLADGLDPAEVGRDHGLLLRYNSVHSRESALTVARVEEARMGEVLARLKSDPRVEAAEPDYLYRALPVVSTCPPLPPAGAALDFPDDPMYPQQWNMRAIEAEGAWRWSTGRHVVVAVIDTGVAYADRGKFRRVEDLDRTRFVQGYNFVANNPYPHDDHAHGTHVAGTIAQSTHNGKGVVGVAFDASIMPLKVLSARGTGTVSDIADAIRFAADHGARVINMSLGGPFPSTVMARAVSYAHRKGMILVCAAGNSGRSQVSYPAAYPECLAVSAVDPEEELTFYTNYGPRIDLAAPGGDTREDETRGVLQNTIGLQDPSTERYAWFMGTSMAAPHVAGVAAMVAAQGVTRPRAVKGVLQATARSKGEAGRRKGYGAGIVNARAAALRVSLGYGTAQLVLGLLAGLMALLPLLRRGRLLHAALTLPGILFGSSGLFFLPLVVPRPTPHEFLFTHGFPAWDIALFGAAGHANPLFYSCLVPVVLSLLVVESSWLRAMVAGLSAGTAGHLFFAALAGTVTVLYLPALLSGLWLVGNGLVCLFLAEVLCEEAL